KEIELHGSWRFHTEFAEAIALLASSIDPEPLISHEFDLVEAERAFRTASDRSMAGKVLLRMMPRAGWTSRAHRTSGLRSGERCAPRAAHRSMNGSAPRGSQMVPSACAACPPTQGRP